MQPHAQTELALEQLSPELLSALLPLGLQETWHPVRSLGVAPDLPDAWWGQVTQALNLTPQADGTVQVPGPVRAALMARLMAAHPHRYRALVGAHAETLLSGGDVVAALTLLHDLGDTGRAETALEQWITDRHVRGEFSLLQEVMVAAPTAWRTDRIRGALWLALLSSPEREVAGQARQELLTAYERGERHPRVLHALSCALQLDGRYEFALQISTQALSGCPEGTDALRLWHQHTMNLNYLSQPEAHLQSAQRFLEEAERACHFSFMGIAHATLAYAREDLGELAQAELHYQQAKELYWRTSYWNQLATLLNNYAKLLCDLGRPAEALEQLSAAAQLPNLAARHHAWIAFTRSTIHHLYGLHAEALASMPEALELLQQAHLEGDALDLRLLWVERLALDGRLDEARRVLRQGAALVGRYPSGAAQMTFTSGVLAYLSQEWAQASQLFQAALDGAMVVPWDQVRAALYLLALDLRRDSATSETLEDRLSAVGHDLPLLTDAGAHQRTLQWLAAQPGWASRLERIFGQSPRTGDVLLRLEPFGPLEIFSQAGQLRFPLRRSAELLAFLALHGSASRQQILAALWEGQADGKTVDLFKKTLRGLRSALQPLLPGGTDPVTLRQGRYALHPLFDVTVAQLPQGFFPAPSVRQVGHPVVRGPFLADGQGPWLEDSRAGIHEALLHDLQVRAGEHDPVTQHARHVLRNLT